MFLHIFAFGVPIIVLVCILFTSDSSRILLVNSDSVVKGSKITDEHTVKKDIYDADLKTDLTVKRDV